MTRNTWQREAVRGALDETRGFVSAQTLHARLREAGSTIGLATVYRALSRLADEGDADSLVSPEGESLYRACETDAHHHHLICRSCGRTVEIEAGAVEAWARDVAAEHGFTRAAHVVDVFGECAECTLRAGGGVPERSSDGATARAAGAAPTGGVSGASASGASASGAGTSTAARAGMA